MMTEAATTVQVVPTTPIQIRSRRHLRPWLQRPAGKIMTGVAMAVILCLSAWAILPQIERFWLWTTGQLLASILPHASASLSIPEFPVPAWSHLATLSISVPEATPDYTTLMWHILGSLGVAIPACWLRAPFRATIVLLAVFHAGLCCISMLADNGQTYDIAHHTRYLSYCAEASILLLPVMMAGAHYIIENSLERRALATVLIAGYLVLAHPFRLVLHALILRNTTSLAEPTLFLMAGPAMDIVLITALYTWVTAWRHHPD